MIKLLLWLFMIFFSGCKFKMSTYSAFTPEQILNEVNIQKIKEQEPNEQPNFKIALIADTHNYYDELVHLIKKINSNGPYGFVIVCGDITNLGLLEEYDYSRKFLNKLKYPYLVSIGNHDHLANGESIFRKMFGKMNFTVTYKGIQFVFFDNNNWENDESVPDIQWVKEQLSDPVPTQRILVAHVPPNDPKRFNESDINEWINVMSVFNVGYFLNGHNHSPSIKSFGSGTQITIGAPTRNSYFELLVSPGGITHQKVNF